LGRGASKAAQGRGSKKQLAHGPWSGIDAQDYDASKAAQDCGIAKERVHGSSWNRPDLPSGFMRTWAT
jgi:hypothetical protein